MKIKILIPLIACFCAAAFSQPVTKLTIKKHCNGFIKTIFNGDTIGSLSFFNKKYLSLQLDSQTKGNAQQFIEEFLSGYEDNYGSERTLIKPSLHDIVRVKLDEIDFFNDSTCYVILKLHLKSGKDILSTAKIAWTDKNDPGFVKEISDKTKNNSFLTRVIS